MKYNLPVVRDENGAIMNEDQTAQEAKKTPKVEKEQKQANKDIMLFQNLK